MSGGALVVEEPSPDDARRASRALAPPLPRGTRNENPAGIGFWSLVREDLRTNEGDLLAPGFWALFWNRFGNWRMGLPRLVRLPFTVLYRMGARSSQLIGGVKLDYTVKVGRRVAIQHFGGMVLGARSIGDDCVIRQNTTFGVASRNDLNAKPRIGDRVDIGAGAVIVGDIVIGDDAVIGANAVVTRDVPPGAVMGGVPAREIKRRPGPPAA